MNKQTNMKKSVKVTKNRKQKKRKNRRRLPAYVLTAGLVILLAAAAIICFSNSKNSQEPADTEARLPSEIKETSSVQTDAAEQTVSNETERKALVLGTSENQMLKANAERALNRPSAQEGWLPVFRGADTDEKIIAITVDDCTDAGNLRQIVDTALSYGQKLTIFPIGTNAERSAIGSVLVYAWENGMELENHTYTHNGLYSCSDEELALEVSRQNYALSKLLGVNYQCHFLRPKGGDARADQRIHTYIDQLGYYGVAHWTVSGTQAVDKIKASLAPGNIYLFHTTDKDLARLLQFIPYAVGQGYTLVTLNELYGYPENETSEFTPVATEADFVQLREYETVYITLSKGSHSYLVKRLQDRLYEMGLLESEGDGIYGDMTSAAVTAYQKQNGMKEDGKASPELLNMILE